MKQKNWDKFRFCIVPLLLLPTLCIAQAKNADFPKQVVIARDTFFDFGPPFHYYEIIQLTQEENRTSVQRVLVAPGEACRLATTVEENAASIEKPLRSVFLSKNPCDIPEKDLNKERNRCKHCAVFSGQNVAMTMTCNGQQRRIRADILDRDLFAEFPKTPKNTSWTMKVLEQIDDALGSGVMDKPAFTFADRGSGNQQERSEILPVLTSLQSGAFDTYIDSNRKLSVLYQESLHPIPPPSVALRNTTLEPLKKDLPSYPPIAEVARIEGVVEVSFDVTATGTTENIAVTGGPEMLRSRTSEAISRWKFPTSTEVRHGQASFVYSMNCKIPN